MIIKAIACALFAFVLVSSGFAACTETDAGQKARVYADQGESVTLEPRAKTYIGTDEYWVIEISYMGQIKAMIPVNAQTCEIDAEQSVEPALKAHYLANYFATDDTISKFLDTTLSYAQGRKQAHQNALNSFQAQEPKIPAGADLQQYPVLKSTISSALSDNDDLRQNRIIPTQSAISAVSKEEDIIFVKESLDSVFSAEDTFLTDIESISATANLFVAELNGDTEMNKPDYSAVQVALVQLANGLIEDVTVRKDALSQNKNAIESFFSDIDSKADGYLAELQNRINNSDDNQKRKEVLEKLQNVTGEANYIFTNQGQIPEEYLDKVTELSTLLNETNQAYLDGNYDLANGNFDAIDAQISELKSLMSSTPACSGGKEWNGAICVCPSGTKEDDNGNCASTGGGFQLNWPLIGGLGAIIAVILLLKFRKPPKETQESGSQDQWKNYGWK